MSINEVHEIMTGKAIKMTRRKIDRMFKKHFQISKLYMIGALLTVLLFLLAGRQVYTSVTVNYAKDPTGNAFVTVYGEDGILKKGEVQDGTAKLYFWGKEITGISPIHYDAYEKLYITGIKLRVHGKTVADMGPEQIVEYFRPNSGIRELRPTAEGICLTTESDQPVLLVTRELQQKIDSTADFMSVLNLVFFLMLYTMIYWYLFRVLDILHHHRCEDILDAVLGIVGIGAMLLSWNIAFTSAYGGTVHPDEIQTRAAVDYYRTHWIQPDVRSDFVAGTVSGYGMTRLSEINLYYLFAGKLANIFDFEMSFRAFGMLMILILCCFVLKNIKKERFLAILFFATPQLWYLFSYATSDAYDYLISVFAIYEVLSENSGLHRILRDPWNKRHIPWYLWAGYLFANLLMAKKTFYTVLVTIFLLLLYHLIFAEREKKKLLFIKYMGLLTITFAIVLVRYAPDLGYYGLHKNEAVEQVIEATALQEYKPSTPAASQAKSTLLHEKGVSLGEFFTEWKFNQELFKNYFGYYGIYSLQSRPAYYLLMGVLYIAFLGTVGFSVHRNIKNRKAKGEQVMSIRLTYWTMWGMLLMMYLLTIYNAYFVDFQPQGRYLFPAIPAIACQMTLGEKSGEEKTVRTIITAIAVVSLYSFYKIAYLNF